MSRSTPALPRPSTPPGWYAEYIQTQGLVGAAGNLARWIAQIPTDITSSIELGLPGPQERGGSDHVSFLCYGAPGFRLQSHYPDYRQYTWHTNRDTYDKIIFDDLKNNATLAAMLMYLASEDPERVPRDRELSLSRSGAVSFDLRRPGATRVAREGPPSRGHLVRWRNVRSRRG